MSAPEVTKATSSKSEKTTISESRNITPKTLKSYFSEAEKNKLNEAEQIQVVPAKQNTQVIKKGTQTLGTVTNPQLAAQIKQSIGKGEMTLAGDKIGEDSKTLGTMGFKRSTLDYLKKLYYEKSSLFSSLDPF